MRLNRDPSLLEVIRRFGTARRLAETLGITDRAVSSWKRIPVRHVRIISEKIGMHPYRIRPDLYVEGFWNMQMNTADIALEMKISEAQVYQHLNDIMVRRRTSSYDYACAALPTVSEPPLESE
jgi:hypothetical protein